MPAPASTIASMGPDAASKYPRRKLPAAAAMPTSGADRSLIHAAVPRRKWDDPDVDDFLRRGEPVVLTGGCPLVQALVGKWSFDYLAESFGSELKLNVHFAPRDTTVFARHYGKGLGTGGCTPMPFPQFVRKARDDHLERDASAAPPPLRYYLQSLMVWSDAPKNVHGELIKPDETQPLSKLNFGAQLERDMGTLGWEWLKEAYTTAGEKTFDTCQLWVGHGGGATPLHFDSISNFLAQVVGRKQVLLFPPAQTFHVYPYPIGHPMDNFAMIDVER